MKKDHDSWHYFSVLLKEWGLKGVYLAIGDLRLKENGLARIGKIAFDAYNERNMKM